MATSHENTLKEVEYQNWLRSGLGLKYLKEGLTPFVTDVIKKQHGKFVENFQQCGSCSLESLLPHHALKVGRNCSLERAKCLCIGSKRTVRTHCTTNVCGQIYDKIVMSHCGDPNFSNTDITQWVTDPWELAKCYINTWGYKDKKSAEDTDCLGILSIIINNLEFHVKIDATTVETCSKVRTYRNEIMHSSNLNVTDGNWKMYIKDMDAILDDPMQLRSDNFAKLARQNLQKLLETDIYISTEDEVSIIHEAQMTLNRNSNIQADTLRGIVQNLNYTNETSQHRFEGIEKAQVSLQNAIDDLKNNIGDQQRLMSDIQQVKTDLESVKAEAKHNHDQIVVLAECIKKVEDVLKEMILEKTQEVKDVRHKEQLDYLEKKKRLQKRLIEIFERHLSTVPISPIFEEMRSPIGEVWVDMNIYDYSFNEQDQTESRELKSYEDIFFENGMRCLNMYMVGGVGMGKTTWCMKLVNDWVKGSQNPLNHVDLKELIMYEIVILIRLRNATKKMEILDMIKEQLFSEDTELYEILTDVLKREPYKCLVIADGLDEWIPPKNQYPQSLIQNQGIPSKAGLNGCPLLITSRLSKLYEIRLKNTQNDRCMIILGTKNKTELAKNIITQLNKSKSVHVPKKISDFENALQEFCGDELGIQNFPWYAVFVEMITYLSSVRILECMENPLLLIISVFIWFHYGNLEKTYAGLYSQMFRYLIEYTLNMKKYKIPTPTEESSVSEISHSLPKCLNKIVPKQYNKLTNKLAKFAFDNLFKDSKKNQAYLVFSEEALKTWFTDNDLQAAVNCGIISQECAINQPLARMTKISFLNKSFEEYFSAVHIVGQFQTNNMEPLEVYQKYCCKMDTIVEMENVIHFVCGLDPQVASKMSLHVQHVASKTDKGADKCLKNSLLLRCAKEVNKFSKEYPSKKYPIHTEILVVNTELYSHNMDAIYNMLTSNITKLKQINVLGNHVVKDVLQCKLPFSLKICVLQDLDLSGFSSEQLKTFGKSLENIKQLESLNLINIKLPYTFTMYLQNCRQLKNVILYGIDFIEIKVNAQAIEFIEMHNCSISFSLIGKFMFDVPLNQVINLVQLLTDSNNTNMTASNASAESVCQSFCEKAATTRIHKRTGFSLEFDKDRKKCFVRIKHGNIQRNNLERFLKILKDCHYLEIKGLDITFSDKKENTFSDRNLDIQTKVLDDLFQVCTVPGLVLNNSQELVSINKKTLFSHRRVKFKKRSRLRNLFRSAEVNCDDLSNENELKARFHFKTSFDIPNSGVIPFIESDTSSKSELLIISNASALETELLITNVLSTEKITRVHMSTEKMDHGLIINLLKCRHVKILEIKLSRAHLRLVDIVECEPSGKQYLMLEDNRVSFSLESGTLICSGTKTKQTEAIVRFVTETPFGGIHAIILETKTINSELLKSLIACEHLCKTELSLSYIALSEIEMEEIRNQLCLHSKCVTYKTNCSGFFPWTHYTSKPMQTIDNTRKPVYMSIIKTDERRGNDVIGCPCTII